jgi:hypothetical protein
VLPGADHVEAAGEGGFKLSSLIQQNPAIFFPLFFVVLWLMSTTVLALLSGWFRLMAEYPDQAIEPILQLRGQSGRMGLVAMRGILTLSVCPSGLRVGMKRVFGPFCRDFFVPWESIAVVRTTVLFSPAAKLQFVDPAVGTLTIPAHTANRLARAAMGRWPEAGPFPEDMRGDRFRRLLAQWAIATCVAALFFTVFRLAMGPSGGGPPIWVTALFPAIFFGVAFFVRFLAGKG